MKTIIVDADAIFALFFSTDSNNKNAVTLLDKYLENNFILANTTFSETITALGRKADKKISLEVLDYIHNQNFVLEPVTNDILLIAESYYRKQNSKKNTFFDCLNMALAKAYQADCIFSFDRGYEQNGFKLLS